MRSPEAALATLLVAKAAVDHYHMLFVGEKQSKDRKAVPSPEAARKKLAGLHEEIKDIEITTVDELFAISGRAVVALKEVLAAQTDGGNRLQFSHPVGHNGSHRVALETLPNGSLLVDSNYFVGNIPGGQILNSHVNVGFKMSANGDDHSVLTTRINTKNLRKRYEIRSTDTNARFIGRVGFAVKSVVEDTLEFL